MNIKDAVDWLQKQIQRDRKLAAKEKARVEKKRAASAERSGADEAPVSSPRTDPTDSSRSLRPEGGALPSAEAGEALPEEEKKEEAGGYQMTAIPIYNVMVLPHSYIYFQTQNFRSLAGNEVQQGDHILLLILKEETGRDQIRPDSFYPIAVEGSVTEINAEGYLVVRTGNRARVEEVHVDEEARITVRTSSLYDVDDLDKEDSRKRLLEIKAELKELASRFRGGNVMQTMIDQYSTIQEVAAILSP